MNITPKSIIKGRNSDGTTFRLEEWDFATLSNLEFLHMAILFIVGLALCPLIAPLLTILSIFRFNGRVKISNIIAIIFGGYFLYDASHGWLMLTAVSFFASESTINILLRLNFASVITSIILLLFSGLFYKYISEPMTSWDEDAYFLASDKEKEATEKTINERKGTSYAIIFSVFVVSFILGQALLGKEGWVDRKISNFDSYEKEVARQDSINDLCGFKSQAEKDKHFEELEKRWGNH